MIDICPSPPVLIKYTKLIARKYLFIGYNQSLFVIDKNVKRYLFILDEEEDEKEINALFVISSYGLNIFT